MKKEVDKGWVDFNCSGKIIGEDLNSVVMKCHPTGKYLAIEYGDAELPPLSELLGREVEVNGQASLLDGEFFYSAFEIRVAKYASDEEKLAYTSEGRHPWCDVYHC
ncbi:MAG: hypothetical protein AAB497_02500 [Patescibacteria group bacterium]